MSLETTRQVAFTSHWEFLNSQTLRLRSPTGEYGDISVRLHRDSLTVLYTVSFGNYNISPDEHKLDSKVKSSAIAFDDLAEAQAHVHLALCGLSEQEIAARIVEMRD